MRNLAVVFALVAVLGLSGAAQGAQLQGPVSAPMGWKAVPNGKVDLSVEESVIVALRRRNVDKLQKTFWEVSDPRHERYGEHLGHEEMTALVGQPTESVDAVLSWLKEHGITKTEVARHRDSIKVRGTRAQLASLLGVQYSLFESADKTKTTARALGALHIPQSLKPIVQMIGNVQDFPLSKAQGPVKPKKSVSYSELPVLTPDDVANVYGVAQNVTPPTSVLQAFYQNGAAVVPSDLTAFCEGKLPSTFDMSRCKISKFIGSDKKESSGAMIETALDSEYLVGISNGALTWAYGSSGTSDSAFCSSFMTLSQDIMSESEYPKVVSASYGLPDVLCSDDVQDRVNEDFQKVGTMGVSIMFAAGDSGAFDYDNTLYASFPAASPYVTAVGGTQFPNYPDSTEQVAWHVTTDNSFEGQQGGSGGGFSSNPSFTRPSYQNAAVEHYLNSGVTMPDATYNTKLRAVPDVAAIAWNAQIYSSYYYSQFEPIGGTSLATPTFSAIVTRLNTIRAESGGKSLGFLNTMLYQNEAAFTDITKGNNAVKYSESEGNKGFECAKGWDPVTGLGAPVFGNLAEVVRSLNAADAARKH